MDNSFLRTPTVPSRPRLSLTEHFFLIEERRKKLEKRKKKKRERKDRSCQFAGNEDRTHRMRRARMTSPIVYLFLDLAIA